MIELLKKLKKLALIFLAIGLAIALVVRENSLPKLVLLSFFIGGGLVLLLISGVKER